MNKQQYDQLASIVFRLDADGKPTYPGYRPEVKELPNGDGKVEADKRYAHVSNKNQITCAAEPTPTLREWRLLDDALMAAHALAMRVAKALDVLYSFLPEFRYGALRILEYPPQATSNLHTDFDLFTLMIYRDQPECFITYDTAPHYCPPSDSDRRLGEARKLNAQLHIGELGELIGLGPATPHEVIASNEVQHAIVYFAIPDHAAVLPQSSERLLADGPLTVGEWLTERMSRSRKEYK